MFFVFFFFEGISWILFLNGSLGCHTMEVVTHRDPSWPIDHWRPPKEASHLRIFPRRNMARLKILNPKVIQSDSSMWVKSDFGLQMLLKKSLPWVQSDFILRAKAVVVQNERPIQPWESELVTAPPLRVVSRSFSLFKPPFVCCFTEMNIQVRLDSMILEATNGLERSIPPHMYPSHKGLCCSHVTIPDHPMSRPTIPSGQKKSLLQPIYTPYNHNMQISI